MFQNTKISRLLYSIKYRYPTREVLLACGIALATIWFMWGSVQAMQKNYQLRKIVDDKAREEKLIRLQTSMLEYKQNYLKSEEYQKLAVREYLGYGDPGEKLLILPANSQKAINTDEKFDSTPIVVSRVKPSNLSQWLNFLFGANVKN